MLHRLRKALAAVLTILLLLCVSAPALAYELPADARDTEFFTPIYHTDLDYDEIEYGFMEAAPLLEEIDALRTLMADAANAGEFESRFLVLADAHDRMYAMNTLLDHRVLADGTDALAAAEKERQQTEYLTLDDAFRALVRDALASPCAGVLASRLRESVRASYLRHQDSSEEELALRAQDQSVISEYAAKAAQRYAAQWNGADYDINEIVQAYYNNAFDIATYALLLKEILRKEVATYGDLLPRMIEVRNQIAAAAGYESYAAYAYRETYGRTYTPEDAADFCEFVKETIVPIYRTYRERAPYPDESRMPEETAFNGSAAAEQLLPCFAQLSDELWESAAYTLEHKATDLDPAPHKISTADTSILTFYNLPYVFQNCTGNWTDLTELIHELGHVNELYWQGFNWDGGSMVLDTMEVHSQGLEMLMLHYYPALFGDEAGAAEGYTMKRLLYSIITGCLYDELQRWAYDTPGVTAEQISEKYLELAIAYGDTEADSLFASGDFWAETPHTFLSPFDYISYATSAVGALGFWEESRTDYFTAVDDYLRFTALPYDTDIADAFRVLGMDSPMSEARLSALAQALREALLRVKPYTDVYLGDPGADAIRIYTELGLMNGVGGGLFAPDAEATRAQGMTVLARMAGADAATLEAGVEWAVLNGISDGAEPDAPLTGEAFAAMLVRYVRNIGLDRNADGAPTVLTRSEMAEMLLEFCASAA